MMQPDRVVAVRARYLARGEEAKLPAKFTADLFELLIAATCKEEDELMAALDAADAGQAQWVRRERRGGPGERHAAPRPAHAPRPAGGRLDAAPATRS